LPFHTLPSLLPGRRDPWWDLEGSGARHQRLRGRVVSLLAFALAIASCGLTAAVWFRLVGPEILARLG
jgi:hypothetical protein